MNVNYGVIIQARLSSRRLPGKVIMDVEGKPMIQRQIERLQAGIPDFPILVATSRDSSDDPLVDFCKKTNVPYYRGPLDDVVQRFIHCAREFGLTHIVRVGGDDPLIDPACCLSLINSHSSESADFIYASHREGWPYGCAAELIAVSSLEYIHSETDNNFYREHTIPYFFDHADRFKIRKLRAPNDLIRPELTFSVDFPEDLELIRTVYSTLKDEGDFFPLERVIELIDTNPEILAINSHLHSGFDR